MDLHDPDLASATAISITFQFQKTNVRDETVHQHATELPILCPVIQWALVVIHILSYPGCDTDSLVSMVVIGDKQKLITAPFLASQLRSAARRIGEDILGFSWQDIGTHSI